MEVDLIKKYLSMQAKFHPWVSLFLMTDVLF